jgi:hypothetical protein
VAQAARNARSDLGRVSQLEFVKELESMGQAVDQPDAFYSTLSNRKEINDTTISTIEKFAPYVTRFSRKSSPQTPIGGGLDRNLILKNAAKIKADREAKVKQP